MSEYIKKRAYNIKGRARLWAENSVLLRKLLSADPGVAARTRGKIMLAVYKLMQEAYSVGYEFGYKEAIERSRQNESKTENQSVEM